MGADVMRWQFCAQPPDRNLLFGFGPGQEIKRRLLTLWNSARFLVDYATIEGFRPEYGAAPSRPSGRSTAGSPRGRTQLVARGDRRLRGLPDRERDARLRGVRRRRLQLVHPPLAAPLLGRRRGRRCRRSGIALVQGLRVVAPVMPFLAEHLWQSARARRRPASPPHSVHLAGWPEAPHARRRRCSTRSPRCGASSASATRLARPSGSSSASRCGGSSSRARRSPRVTRTSCARSCASRRSSSATSRRPSCT